MFRVKAGTPLRVYAPFGKPGSPAAVVEGNTAYYDTAPWKPYVTKESKLYDKEQVWDPVAVLNNRDDVPRWAKHNIELSKYTEAVLCCDGKYALVKTADLEYID